MFEIEKNIPAPIANPFANYPFDNMEINDSFYVEQAIVPHNTVSARVSSYRKLNPNKNFTTKRDENGIRVWRTA